jgi:trehalose 6-phosphate synthase/phosphatase
LKYLSSDHSKWSHTLIGWPGEIGILQEHHGGDPWIATAAAAATTTNRDTAPIPVNASAPSLESHSNSEIRISLASQIRLKQKLAKAQGGRVELVWLADEIDEQGTVTLRDQHKWRQYGEHELFTLFHFQQNQPSDDYKKKKESWRCYERMNETFADAIVAKYKPGDIVLVHDYQLLLLPAMLRKRIPAIYIGFFLHIPFPSHELYRSLSLRKGILEGILGANMIGFQEKHYAQDFTDCCGRLLGLGDTPAGVDMEGTIVPVDTFPIGIDTNTTHISAYESPSVEEEMKKLLDRHAGKKIIVGRDRLDSLRGVKQKLMAFELFLERHPEWHEKVVLIQITSPTSVKEHDAKREKTEMEIAELVTRINGNFGSLSFTPVLHYSQYLPEDEYFALLRVADAALITSVRDGMNTTALEYILCQCDKHGPLIISEFSGTAGNLNSAMRINPLGFSDVAKTLDKVLTMSEEDKARAHDKLYQYVTVNNIQNWTHKLLKRLLTNLSAFELTHKTPLLDQVKLQVRYGNSSRRLFLFDYDGTLTPIVRDPQAAVPSDKIIRTLKTLAADPSNAVWIISGRDQAFLDEYMGDIPALGLSAEHGSFVREPREPNAPCSSIWDDLTKTFDMSWQDEAMEVFQRYTDATKGSNIERKKIAMTWHYRRADPELGISQAEMLKLELQREIATKYEVDVMTGKANVEVRPRFVNKGEIVKRLIQGYGGEVDQVPDFVFCLGDDHTDEGERPVFLMILQANKQRRHVSRAPRVEVGRQHCLCYHHWSSDEADIGEVASHRARGSD